MFKTFLFVLWYLLLFAQPGLFSLLDILNTNTAGLETKDSENSTANSTEKPARANNDTSELEDIFLRQNTVSEDALNTSVLHQAAESESYEKETYISSWTPEPVIYDSYNHNESGVDLTAALSSTNTKQLNGTVHQVSEQFETTAVQNYSSRGSSLGSQQKEDPWYLTERFVPEYLQSRRMHRPSKIPDDDSSQYVDQFDSRISPHSNDRGLSPQIVKERNSMYNFLKSVPEDFGKHLKEEFRNERPEGYFEVDVPKLKPVNVKFVKKNKPNEITVYSHKSGPYGFALQKETNSSYDGSKIMRSTVSSPWLYGYELAVSPRFKKIHNLHNKYIILPIRDPYKKTGNKRKGVHLKDVDSKGGQIKARLQSDKVNLLKELQLALKRGMSPTQAYKFIRKMKHQQVTSEQNAAKKKLILPKEKFVITNNIKTPKPRFPNINNSKKLADDYDDSDDDDEDDDDLDNYDDSEDSSSSEEEELHSSSSSSEELHSSSSSSSEESHSTSSSEELQSPEIFIDYKKSKNTNNSKLLKILQMKTRVETSRLKKLLKKYNFAKGGESTHHVVDQESSEEELFQRGDIAADVNKSKKKKTKAKGGSKNKKKPSPKKPPANDKNVQKPLQKHPEKSLTEDGGDERGSTEKELLQHSDILMNLDEPKEETKIKFFTTDDQKQKAEKELQQNDDIIIRLGKSSEEAKDKFNLIELLKKKGRIEDMSFKQLLGKYKPKIKPFKTGDKDKQVSQAEKLPHDDDILVDMDEIYGPTKTKPKSRKLPKETSATEGKTLKKPFEQSSKKEVTQNSDIIIDSDMVEKYGNVQLKNYLAKKYKQRMREKALSNDEGTAIYVDNTHGKNKLDPKLIKLLMKKGRIASSRMRKLLKKYKQRMYDELPANDYNKEKALEENFPQHTEKKPVKNPTVKKPANKPTVKKPVKNPTVKKPVKVADKSVASAVTKLRQKLRSQVIRYKTLLKKFELCKGKDLPPSEDNEGEKEEEEEEEEEPPNENSEAPAKPDTKLKDAPNKKVSKINMDILRKKYMPGKVSPADNSDQASSDVLQDSEVPLDETGDQASPLNKIINLVQEIPIIKTFISKYSLCEIKKVLPILELMNENNQQPSTNDELSQNADVLVDFGETGQTKPKLKPRFVAVVQKLIQFKMATLINLIRQLKPCNENIPPTEDMDKQVSSQEQWQKVSETHETEEAYPDEDEQRAERVPKKLRKKQKKKQRRKPKSIKNINLKELLDTYTPNINEKSLTIDDDVSSEENLSQQIGIFGAKNTDGKSKTNLSKLHQKDKNKRNKFLPRYRSGMMGKYFANYYDDDDDYDNEYEDEADNEYDDEEENSMEVKQNLDNKNVWNDFVSNTKKRESSNKQYDAEIEPPNFLKFGQYQHSKQQIHNLPAKEQKSHFKPIKNKSQLWKSPTNLKHKKQKQKESIKMDPNLLSLLDTSSRLSSEKSERKERIPQSVSVWKGAGSRKWRYAKINSTKRFTGKLTNHKLTSLESLLKSCEVSDEDGKQACKNKIDDFNLNPAPELPIRQPEPIQLPSSEEEIGQPE